MRAAAAVTVASIQSTVPTPAASSARREPPNAPGTRNAAAKPVPIAWFRTALPGTRAVAAEATTPAAAPSPVARNARHIPPGARGTRSASANRAMIAAWFQMETSGNTTIVTAGMI